LTDRVENNEEKKDKKKRGEDGLLLLTPPPPERELNVPILYPGEKDLLLVNGPRVLQDVKPCAPTDETINGDYVYPDLDLHYINRNLMACEMILSAEVSYTE